MLDDIKKTLWATADKLRANMDAAEYKHLVLGLIFIKYISDSFEAHKTSLTQRLRNPEDELFYGDASDEDIAAELEDRDYFTAANVFWVPEGARWAALQAAAPQPDIGKRIDDALTLIEQENPRLKGILDKRFARAQLPDGKLGELVNLVATIGFGENPSAARDEFLAQVQNLPEKNLAVELLERLLQGEIKSRFASNVVQDRKFSDMLADVIRRYQNRSIETAQVIEELIAMAKKFRAAAERGDALGLREDEIKFYDALANNESAVRELQDETLKKIAQELTASLRENLTVDWSERESVRAKLRLMVRRILRKYKYPPDQAEGAVELVLEQAQSLGEVWSG